MRRIILPLLVLLLCAASSNAQLCFPDPACTYTVPPATEAIVAGGTITANACGSVKNITAAGAITTNTTDTFTAPSSSTTGCVMTVCNQSANTITLDSNTNFPGVAAGNVALTQDDCVLVVQSGARWLQAAAVLSNN
jgi:copper(I)-binding protein